MVGPATAYQAVVLAGGEDQILYPLTTNTVKALLPVANRPLISYPLRTLAEAGLRSAIVVSACLQLPSAAHSRHQPATLQPAHGAQLSDVAPWQTCWGSAPGCWRAPGLLLFCCVVGGHRRAGCQQRARVDQ
jgi:hypothetical protein